MITKRSSKRGYQARHRKAPTRSAARATRTAGALAVAGTTVAGLAVAAPAGAATGVPNDRGMIDSVVLNAGHGAVLRGWTFDPREPASRNVVNLTINGYAYHNYWTGIARPDVRAAYRQTHLMTGFTIVTGALPYGSFKICLTRLGVHTGAPASLLGCRIVNRPAPVAPTGARIAAQAKTMVGRYRYASGGSSPATGFDCSGLSSYVYRSNGIGIQRTADQQYRQFRPIGAAAARPGDLIFFHSGGGTFHVGIYQSPGLMVAAATPSEGIKFQSYSWWPNISFGTLTH